MDKEAIQAERASLQGILDADKFGKAVLEIGRAEYIDSVKRRIAQLDRKLAEDWRA